TAQGGIPDPTPPAPGFCSNGRKGFTLVSKSESRERGATKNGPGTTLRAVAEDLRIRNGSDDAALDQLGQSIELPQADVRIVLQHERPEGLLEPGARERGRSHRTSRRTGRAPHTALRRASRPRSANDDLGVLAAAAADPRLARLVVDGREGHRVLLCDLPVAQLSGSNVGDDRLLAAQAISFRHLCGASGTSWRSHS